MDRSDKGTVSKKNIKNSLYQQEDNESNFYLLIFQFLDFFSLFYLCVSMHMCAYFYMCASVHAQSPERASVFMWLESQVFAGIQLVTWVLGSEMVLMIA